MIASTSAVINQVKGWTPPTFHQGKECFVSFSAFDPVSSKMKRKKIMIGRIKGKTAQKRYAQTIIQRLTEKLLEGWNPWIELSSPLEYTKFCDVAEKYKAYLYKMFNDGDLREETLAGYVSYLKIFSTWCQDNRIIYIYQVDRHRVSDFLDYVFIDRNNTLQTRNNYLVWLKVFSSWLVQRCYLTSNPTEGMTAIRRKDQKKNRDVMSESDLRRLHDYLMDHNRHFLLACYLLHYMFIRPHEMTYIRIGDINLEGPTLSLYGENTKNHNDAVLTIPAKVVRLMIDLKIFDHPSSDYLFSRKFRPGRERKSEKSFRDYWIRDIRRDLHFSDRIKFYSLKDTGITNMLRSNMDVLTVRDQARHSSILITDTYTPKDVKEANEALVHYDGPL